MDQFLSVYLNAQNDHSNIVVILSYILKKLSSVEELISFLRQQSVKMEEINSYLISIGEEPLTQGRKLYDVVLRSAVKISELSKVVAKLGKYLSERDIAEEVISQTEIQIKYRGYIEREKFFAEKLLRLENIVIPSDFDYNAMQSLTIEARQKLTRQQPKTIGQASRIPGVSPADINVLLIKFGR